MAPRVGMLKSPCSTSYTVPLRPAFLRNVAVHSFYSCRHCPGWSHSTFHGSPGSRQARCTSAVRVSAGIKVIESYDGKFELAKDSEDALKQLLASPTFAKQVVQETGQPEGTEISFTGMLFQPVPWSMQTKKGMPAEYEKYAADPDYVIINTPPNFMFQAKIFKPSRLCAIFKRK